MPNITLSMNQNAEEGKIGEGELVFSSDEKIEVNCVNCDGFSFPSSQDKENQVTFKFNYRATAKDKTFICPLNFKVTFAEINQVTQLRYGIYFCPKKGGCSQTKATTGCLIQ